jgi:hypothetical protein
MRSEMSFDPPIAEIAELAERMRQPGHRRSRQASTRGKLGISERGCTGFEGFEHHQPLGERRRKAGIAGAFGQRFSSRGRQGRLVSRGRRHAPPMTEIGKRVLFLIYGH